LEIAQGLEEYGMTLACGVPYLYSVWKSKKAKWRHIVGVHQEDAVQSTGKPVHPADEVHVTLVECFEQVMHTLKEKDRGRRMEGVRAFWVVESQQEFAEEVRSGSLLWGHLPMKTVDFEDMYTNLSHDLILHRVMDAALEAFSFEAEKRGTAVASLKLGKQGWNTDGSGLDMGKLADFLSKTLKWCFVMNGTQVRRQTRGLPMGIRPAPQLANLTCYTG
jgi:hypothetical protein